MHATVKELAVSRDIISMVFIATTATLHAVPALMGPERFITLAKPGMQTNV
jgi:hypothetical protein